MYKGINRSDTVTLFLIPLGFLTPPTSSLNLRGLGFHQLVIQQISFFMHLISLIPLYLYISLFNFYDDRWRVGLQSGGNNLHLWCFIYRAPASAPKPARFFGFSLLIGIFSVRASCSISWQGICFFALLIFVPTQELLKQSFHRSKFVSSHLGAVVQWGNPRHQDKFNE